MHQIPQGYSSYYKYSKQGYSSYYKYRKVIQVTTNTASKAIQVTTNTASKAIQVTTNTARLSTLLPEQPVSAIRSSHRLHYPPIVCSNKT
jgi:hypothetical protein